MFFPFLHGIIGHEHGKISLILVTFLIFETYNVEANIDSENKEYLRIKTSNKYDRNMWGVKYYCEGYVTKSVLTGSKLFGIFVGWWKWGTEEDINPLVKFVIIILKLFVIWLFTLLGICYCLLLCCCFGFLLRYFYGKFLHDCLRFQPAIHGYYIS